MFDDDELEILQNSAGAFPVGLGGFTVEDSGERQEFDSGMVRDTEEGKVLTILTYDGPMLERWEEHLTSGAAKYDPRNWMQAQGIEEFERFLTSADRHFRNWLRNRLSEWRWWQRTGKYSPVASSEDEAAATWFNMNGVEYVRDQQAEPLTLEEATYVALTKRQQAEIVEETYE